MANASRKQGFRPYRELLRVRPYRASGALYPGDIVKKDVGGTTGDGINLAGAQIAAAGDTILGAVMSYASAAGKVVLVADHPEQLFIAQVEGSAIADGTNLGSKVINHIANAADTTYKVSRQTINGADDGAATARTFKIVALAPQKQGSASGSTSPDNAYGDKARVIVEVNMHVYKTVV
jgi:hypothetical protein